jgi:phospholipid N-methyltransferase
MVTTIHLNKMKIQTDLSQNEHQKEFMKDLKMYFDDKLRYHAHF